MKRVVATEEEMMELGKFIAGKLEGSRIIELIGDVGAGKTTFTKGLALGLGTDETVQSPTFTLQRVYQLPNSQNLVHYDFYRLNDAGLMKAELDDNINQKDTTIVIEWSDVVSDVLPSDRVRVAIKSLSENEREVEIEGLKSD